MMQDLAFAIPGVDEAMSFAEIMKYVSLSMPVPSAHTFTLQTRQIDGIFCDSLRYRPNRAHPPVPLISECT
jgi:hypothetical protein